MATSKYPTFFMVHGAVHGGWCYEPLIEELKRVVPESKAVAITLPSSVPVTDTTTPPQTLDKDVDYAVAELEKVLDAGEDVIIVCHSYGGIVGGDIVGKVIEKRGRGETSSESGQVLWMVYLTAYPAVENKSAHATSDGMPEAEAVMALPTFTLSEVKRASHVPNVHSR